MTHIELTEREATLLTDILESYLLDLRAEIVATDRKDWRNDMKERENFGKDLLERLRSH